MRIMRKTNISEKIGLRKTNISFSALWASNVLRISVVFRAFDDQN